MIMMGLEFTGEVPFHTVYLHGLIRDEHGKKMSKSYGNVIDPLEVMDKLGTDALRFTLLVGSTPGNDMNLSLKKVEANRNFANKVWNAARFVISAVQDLGEKGVAVEEKWRADLRSHDLYLSNLSLADRWILARTAQLIRDVDRLFQGYQYGEAGRQVYDFFWSEFADWYIEIAKLQISAGGQSAFTTVSILVGVLDISLRLLHPFTPFVTEEIWSHLKQAVLYTKLTKTSLPEHYSSDFNGEEALIVAHWPEPAAEQDWEQESIADFSIVMDVVHAIRNLRAEKSVPPNRRIPAIMAAGERTHILQEQSTAIATLARLDEKQISFHPSLEGKPAGHVALVVGPVEVYLPLAGLVDPHEERARLEKDLAETEAVMQRLEALLSGPFSEKAPAAVVQKERERLAASKETAEKLRAQLAALG
jgi:valyl-tRNA synthetase